MNPVVKVYSHPRSGTNLLMYALYRNFYLDRDDLSVEIGPTGHWSRKSFAQYHIGQQSSEDIPYGKLGGDHEPYPPDDISNCIYIIRDPRNVLVSCYNWKDLRPEWHQDLTFSQFLTTPLDWGGSPGTALVRPDKNIFNIMEHWVFHVQQYINKGMPYLFYEDLLERPEAVMEAVAEMFDLKFVNRDFEWKTVGWAPSGDVSLDKWKKVFSQADIDLLESIIPRNFRGLRYRRL